MLAPAATQSWPDNFRRNVRIVTPDATNKSEVNRNEQFELWVREHAAILHHVARAFSSPEDRDDLMQEILLAVWRAVPGFRGDSSPTTYLYRVSHNAAMTWRRKRPRAMEMPAAEAKDSRLDQLYSGIRELPVLDRSLILLHLDGLAYREIAAIHGITENLVGTRLTRARARLLELIHGGNS